MMKTKYNVSIAVLAVLCAVKAEASRGFSYEESNSAAPDERAYEVRKKVKNSHLNDVSPRGTFGRSDSFNNSSDFSSFNNSLSREDAVSDFGAPSEEELRSARNYRDDNSSRRQYEVSDFEAPSKEELRSARNYRDDNSSRRQDEVSDFEQVTNAEKKNANIETPSKLKPAAPDASEHLEGVKDLYS